MPFIILLTRNPVEEFLSYGKRVLVVNRHSVPRIIAYDPGVGFGAGSSFGSDPGFGGHGPYFGQSLGLGFFQGGQGLFLGQPGGRCLPRQFGLSLSLVLGLPGRSLSLGWSLFLPVDCFFSCAPDLELEALAASPEFLARRLLSGRWGVLRNR